MQRLLAATCLTPLVFLASTQASAEHVISTAVTTPVATGTVNDDIRVSSSGSVKPTSGAAIIINSNHDVRNEGTIGVTGANDSTGILANANVTADITNVGTITIDENFTPTDGDNDGDLDGPFAQGSNRYGIRVLGPGTFTGNVSNTGTITVEGNNSAGISIESALTGALTANGTISVTGNDSFGVRAQDVSGNVTVAHGAIAVRGEDSVGVALQGDIGGALVIQSAITATGYRNTTAPADVSKLDADDLLQGGSAVVVSGNVAGGILLDIRPADSSTTDTDEDDDGIADAQEGNAAVVSFGAAPAFAIGSTTEDIVIGDVATNADGHGLVIKGTVTGAGVYKTINATGLKIGGTGNAVTIEGGMTVSGGVGASAVEANAVGAHIAAGASVPVIKVSGTISAQGGGTATTGSTGLLIDTGATVNTIRNSGTISAVRAGTAGTASAIVDKAGTVTLIENTGFIGVGSAGALGDLATAFDLRANTSGVTVRQLVVTSGAAPSIAGNMLFGTGNDVLEIADGLASGTARFDAGDNRLTLSGDGIFNGNVVFGAGIDTVELGGTSSLNGNVDFGGGGGVMTLAGTSVYRGALSNSAGVALTVGAGTSLMVTNTGTISLGSLTTGANSTLGVTLNGTTGAVTLYDITGAADFGTGTKIDVTVQTVGGIAGTYKIIDAGTLTGAANLTSIAQSLPFLYATSLDTATANEISLVVRLKTADELGLNDSESSILDAVIGAADSDAEIASVFLGIQDQDLLRSSLQQMLPDHAGGAFENVTKGSRLSAGILGDPRPSLLQSGDWGLWLQQVAWGNSKSIGSTSSYDLTGWGASAGFERTLGGAGSVGVTLAYLTGKDEDSNHSLLSSQYEGGVYWRGGIGPLRGFARATVGRVDFDGTRHFTGTIGGTPVIRNADGSWNGTMFSGVAGVSYDARFGRLSLRPSATVEYFRLKEKGYSESGGGDAFNLTVEGRSSNETAAVGMVTVGYDLLSQDPNEPWLRVELEGGRRQILSGSLGDTEAAFDGGTPFRLTPEDRTSGWRAGLRVLGGGPTISLLGEIGGEEQQGRASIGGRVGVQFAL